MITKEQIIEKQFDIERKGYSRVQVDKFLDEIALDVETLTKKCEQYNEMQESIMNCLVKAQSNSDEMVGKAKDEAEKIIAEANRKADSILFESRKRIAYLNDDVLKLENASKEYKEKLILDMDRLRALLDGSFTDMEMPQLSAEATEATIDLEQVYSEAPETETELKEMINEIL